MKLHPLLFTIALLMVLQFQAMPAFSQDSVPIDVQISIPGLNEKEFLPGERIQVNVSFRNKSSEPIYIIDSPNNSPYPLFGLDVNGPLKIEGADTYSWIDIVGLWEENFILLHPGESHTILPSLFTTCTPYTVGRYEVELAVDFIADITAAILVSNQTLIPAAIQDKWAQVPKVKVSSNRLSLQVISNGKTLDPRVHCLMGMPREEVERVFDFLREEEHSIFYTAGERKLHAWLHFNQWNVVDGVRTETYSADWVDDYLKWMRGLDPYDLEKVSREDNKFVIDVGYTAGLNLSSIEEFSVYR